MSILKSMTLCSLFTSLLLIPSFAQHFLGAFSGLVLQVDTQLESPVQNNNVQTLPEQETGDTIRFQLFVPAGAGHSTNGYTVELDLPGKTFSSYIGNVSGKDWTGGALIGTGSTKSALFTTGVSVPSTGYWGQLDLQVMRPLKDGATLIVKSLSITSGSNVDVLDGLCCIKIMRTAIPYRSSRLCPEFDLYRIGPSQGSHPIEDSTVGSGFHLLTFQGMRQQLETEDSLITRHSCFSN